MTAQTPLELVLVCAQSKNEQVAEREKLRQSLEPVSTGEGDRSDAATRFRHGESHDQSGAYGRDSLRIGRGRSWQRLSKVGEEPFLARNHERAAVIKRQYRHPRADHPIDSDSRIRHGSRLHRQHPKAAYFSGSVECDPHGSFSVFKLAPNIHHVRFRVFPC
jgi:hypothetical protein